MGFMLLGLFSGVVGGTLLTAADAYSTALFSVVVYVLMTLGAFGVLLYLSRKGFECETLDDLRGLNRRSPWFAFVMMVLMFSLAGLPPTAGFYAKLAVLSSAVQAGQLWLAVAAVILSLVGAFYYLRIVKLMYFDEPKEAGPVPGQSEMRVLLSLDRKSTRLNSSHLVISYAVFCLKKKKKSQQVRYQDCYHMAMRLRLHL